MTFVEQMAAFASKSSYDDLTEVAREQVKRLVLDTIGCAIGSLGSEPITFLRETADLFGGASLCTLIGGGKTAPDRAAFYNGVLARYLDYSDSYLGALATCHPSDNMSPVLAAAEQADASGKEFMVSLTLAYEVQGRLCDLCPAEKSGFDQGLSGAYSSAAGASRALGLDAAHTANAIAISAVSQNPFRVTRSGHISHWKGFAVPNAAFNGVHATFMAMRGVTGPLEVVEGPLGLFENITGPFEIDWEDKKLERVLRVSLKRYNSGVHAQTAIEGVIELKDAHGFAPDQVERVDIETYARSFSAMGGGDTGGKHDVRNKETADHSMPYVVAAALLDGEVNPAQFEQARIESPDIQDLLRRVYITNSDELTGRYPAESANRIRISMKDGTVHEKEKPGWEGFFAQPMSWDTIVDKFEVLSAPHADASLQSEIVDAVSRLDAIQTTDLTALLEKVN